MNDTAALLEPRSAQGVVWVVCVPSCGANVTPVRKTAGVAFCAMEVPQTSVSNWHCNARMTGLQRLHPKSPS